MHEELEFDVFLSHSHADREWVARLRSALEARSLRVWWDETHAGDFIAESLATGLAQSRCVVVVVSPEAMSSGWVKEEYSRAVALASEREQPLLIIPAILGDAEMPGFLRNRAWVDFRSPHGFEDGLDRLVGGITRQSTTPREGGVVGIAPDAPRPRKPLVAVTMGDANGIGPQVVLKALRRRCSAREICVPVVIGSLEHLTRERAALVANKYSVPELVSIESLKHANDDSDKIFVIDLGAAPPRFQHLGPREPNAEIAKLSEEYTLHAVELAQQGEVAAIVSGPVSKEAALKAGTRARGHAELIAEKLGLDTHVMFLSAGVAVSLVTNHLPLLEVMPLLTVERISETIVKAAEQFRVWRPQAELSIGVCSIDPHGGEGGLLGRTDQEVVTPAVEAARTRIYDRYPDASVDGPRPADVLFRPQVITSYTLIVALYHDQAKSAIAALGSNNFIAALAGGGIIRTTTTHGTAFDIAGQTTASSANLLYAIENASYLSDEGTEYLLSSPDIHATRRYDIERRLNRATMAKNRLGEVLCKLDALAGFLSSAEQGEFRVCFGPGSTPMAVAVHLLAWVRKSFADTRAGVDILTNNLLICDHARTLSRDFLGRLWVFGREWNRRNDSLTDDGHVRSTVEEFKPHLSVISCSGITHEGGEASFYAYNEDHATTLSGIVEGNRKLSNQGHASLLVMVATGEKLGRAISFRYARARDFAPQTTLLLEHRAEVRCATGVDEINRLVERRA